MSPSIQTGAWKDTWPLLALPIPTEQQETRVTLGHCREKGTEEAQAGPLGEEAIVTVTGGQQGPPSTGLRQWCLSVSELRY